MFNLILFIALIGMTTPEINDVSAPIAYSLTINWDPENCVCGTIEIKQLDWILQYGTSTIGGENDKVVSGTSYPYDGDGNVITDCPDCYRLTATIEYIDGSGKCCEGTAVDYFDGDELIEGTVVLDITMN